MSVGIVSLVGGCGSCDDSKPAPQTRTLPVELADAQSLGVLADWRKLPHLGSGRYLLQSSFDRSKEGQRDFNNFVCYGSDAAGAYGAFHFESGACSDPEARGLVLARFEGSGRLSRIWLTATSLAKGRPDDEVVSFYLDGETAPRLSVPLADMLGADGTELFAPPFGAGSKRYVAWYYPVVFSKKLIIALEHANPDTIYWHQTSVVLDDALVNRGPGADRLVERDRTITLLREGPEHLEPTRHQLTIAPGDSKSVEVEGPATISRAVLTVDKSVSLKDIQLEVWWDDAAQPAIHLKIGDLFVAETAIGRPSSLVLSTKDLGNMVEHTLSLPMPFKKRAKWLLFNNGSAEASFELGLATQAELPPEPWGHLHTQVSTTRAPTELAMHRIFESDQRGRLVGVCLSMRGHGAGDGGFRGPTMEFLEGDDILRLDGKHVFHGTGVEDYFNGAFYFADGAQATPFAQVWNIVTRNPDDPEHAGADACRWHVLGDAIDFAQSLEFAMEIGPGAPETLDEFRSIAYAYLLRSER